jgi:hypothetical protein
MEKTPLTSCSSQTEITVPLSVVGFPMACLCLARGVAPGVWVTAGAFHMNQSEAGNWGRQELHRFGFRQNPCNPLSPQNDYNTHPIPLPTQPPRVDRRQSNTRPSALLSTLYHLINLITSTLSIHVNMSRPIDGFKKTERTHEENQERYVTTCHSQNSC